MKKYKTVQSEDVFLRLDAYIAKEQLAPSRAFAHKLITDGCVLVNGKNEKVSYKVKENDEIMVDMPDAPKESDILREDIPLDILYEDSDLIVVNKARGVVVHPAPGNSTGTLVNALLGRGESLSSIGGVERPGIIHRLDKDTSGALIVAKNDFTHNALSKDLSERKVIRQYVAIVKGNFPNDKVEVDAPIGRSPRDRKRQTVISTGRHAKTTFVVNERFPKYTYITLRLHTGRTHQIRVHMAYIGRPVAGDPTYGGKIGELGLCGQALHAEYVEFVHPRTKEKMSFVADMPQDFQNALEELRAKNK